MNVERLTGERSVLRPWVPDDAGWYVEARDDTVFAFTTERRDLTEDEVRAAIEAAAQDPSAVRLAIEDLDGELVGNVAADISGDTAEISYFLCARGRGRGLITDAVATLTRWLARQGLTRLTAVAALGNQRSTRVLERIGFVQTGCIHSDRLGTCTEWELIA